MLSKVNKSPAWKRGRLSQSRSPLRRPHDGHWQRRDRYCAGMLTQPGDLAEGKLQAAVAEGWGFDAAELRYLAVGFGSHHWLASSADGSRLFLTVDDLDAKLSSFQDTTDAAFGRLERAFATALSLRRDCGLQFVLAPIPARDGNLLTRLEYRYSLVVHPYAEGEHTGTESAFDSAADRDAMLGLLAELHAARPDALPIADDFKVPNLDELRAAAAGTDRPWDTGPYGERARTLLAAQAGDLARLLTSFDRLTASVAARPDRMVVTHGEPGAHNVLRTAAGLILVDWDSVLLAAPERDLWDFAVQDRSAVRVYSVASGADVDEDALAFYRMWYDLFEIGGYLRLFRREHHDTADAAESWRNLQDFLQPATRWPEEFAARR
jgi:spectinomycin phosphotransferase